MQWCAFGLVGLGFGLCVVWASVAQAQTLEWLGPAGGGFRDGANVSADGAVVGYHDDASTIRRWTAATGSVELVGATGIVTGLTQDGSTVVGSTTSNAVYQYGHGWRWTSAGGYTVLPLSIQVPPASGSYAQGVSRLGRVGGAADAGPTTAPAYWETSGSQVYVDALGTIYSVYNISPNGSVLVGFQSFSLACGQQCAMKWVSTAGGPFVRSAVGTNPGSAGGIALAASSNGDVILGVNSTSDDGGWSWTQATGVQLLATAGWTDATGYALSENGARIVGVGRLGGATKALVWDGVAATPRSLEDILTNDYGFALGGDVLNSALDISADGLTIVGKGVDTSSGSSTRVFRAVLPAAPPLVPALQPWAICALVALLGLLGITAARRRRSFTA